MMPVSSS